MHKILLLFILCSSILQAEQKALFVDFSVLGAVVSPTKMNGATWDRGFSINKSIGSLISNMVIPGAGFAVEAVLGSIGKDAAKGQAAPDVIGYIMQTGYSQGSFRRAINMPVGLANKKQKSQDSYTPDFSTSYLGWPIYENTRFRIKLYDADLFKDDPMGTVEITSRDIVQAIKANKPLWINVSQQSSNQILFVQISASRVVGKSRPDIKGVRWK
mgnify:CR=1 FL=1